MNKPMMKCGHAANARDLTTNDPVCVICTGIDPGARVVESEPPSLECRTMRCHYRPEGHADKPSSRNGAFFAYRPEQKMDDYYCGCSGWD